MRYLIVVGCLVCSCASAQVLLLLNPPKGQKQAPPPDQGNCTLVYGKTAGDLAVKCEPVAPPAPPASSAKSK